MLSIKPLTTSLQMLVMFWRYYYHSYQSKIWISIICLTLSLSVGTEEDVCHGFYPLETYNIIGETSTQKNKEVDVAFALLDECLG